MAITSADKDRAINHLRNWYHSFANASAYYHERGNEKSTEYNKTQMKNLEWLANLIKSIEAEDGDEGPF